MGKEIKLPTVEEIVQVGENGTDNVNWKAFVKLWGLMDDSSLTQGACLEALHNFEECLLQLNMRGVLSRNRNDTYSVFAGRNTGTINNFKRADPCCNGEYYTSRERAYAEGYLEALKKENPGKRYFIHKWPESALFPQKHYT